MFFHSANWMASISKAKLVVCLTQHVHDFVSFPYMILFHFLSQISNSQLWKDFSLSFASTFTENNPFLNFWPSKSKQYTVHWNWRRSMAECVWSASLATTKSLPSRGVQLSCRLVVLHHHMPSFGSHEALWGCGSFACHFAHLCARDEEKVVLVFRAEEVHCFLLQVVGCHAERDNLKLGETRCHCQNLGRITEKEKSLITVVWWLTTSRQISWCAIFFESEMGTAGFKTRIWNSWLMTLNLIVVTAVNSLMQNVWPLLKNLKNQPVRIHS